MAVCICMDLAVCTVGVVSSRASCELRASLGHTAGHARVTPPSWRCIRRTQSRSARVYTCTARGGLEQKQRLRARKGAALLPTSAVSHANRSSGWMPWGLRGVITRMQGVITRSLASSRAAVPPPPPPLASAEPAASNENISCRDATAARKAPSTTTCTK